MQKYMLVVTYLTGLLWAVAGVVTLCQYYKNKRKSSLKRGLGSLALGIGWGITAAWPDAWLWGIPTWLVATMAFLFLDESADKSAAAENTDAATIKEPSSKS